MLELSGVRKSFTRNGITREVLLNLRSFLAMSEAEREARTQAPVNRFNIWRME